MYDLLHDRESAFAAAEYDVWSRVRLFGGWEGARTNIDPDLSLQASRVQPRTVLSRGFGGVRVQLGPRTTLTLRAEDGDRIASPVIGGLERESDTGAQTAEVQSTFGSVTTYTRYSRRENVDRGNADASYLQDDVSAQLFMRLSQSTQLFGLGTFTRHETGTFAGSTYWQVGGGAQVQLWDRNLWIRGEGTASLNVDLLTRDFVPRESYNVGLNGDLSRGSSIAFNITADRTPLLFTDGSPWTTRSTVRFVQTFSTGTARVPAGLGTAANAAATRARGTGTILGSVFTDWNANGTKDPDEAPIENIPVRLTAGSGVTTRRDGEFSFLNVPAGTQEVGLDTSAIPIDFDPPAEGTVSLEFYCRNTTRRVSFGLIPLGTVRGRVVRDANANGRVDPGEEPIEGAVLVLDGGARSEQVRRGAYRFDSIRSGDHVVSLLRDSLPEGAVVTGGIEIPLALKRDQLSVEDPLRGGDREAPRESPRLSLEDRQAHSRRPRSPRRPLAHRPPRVHRRRLPPHRCRFPAHRRPRRRRRHLPRHPWPVPCLRAPRCHRLRASRFRSPHCSTRFARATSCATSHAAAIPPTSSNLPRRIPMGRIVCPVRQYPTRAAAAAAVNRIERERGEKLWVIREPAAAGGSEPR